jgi:protein CpxP
MKKILVAALLFVGLTTFAQGKSKPQVEKMSTEQKVAQKVERITSELNLTEKQVAEIKIMVEKEMTQKEANKARIKALREELKPTKEEREAVKSEMKRILTPEQFNKLQELQKIKRKEKKAVRKEKQ